MKTLIYFITYVGDQLRPKTDQEKRVADTTALIIAVGAAITLILHYYLT